MKRSLIYVLVLAVMLTALGVWGINSSTKTATAADTVSYFLPYLTTDTSAPVYCIVSNMGTTGFNGAGNDDNVTTIAFTVLANSSGVSSRATSNILSSSSLKIPIRKTRLLSFSNQVMTVDGTSALDLSTDTGTGTLASFGGRLDFIATSSVGPAIPANGITNVATSMPLRGSFNCTTMGMTCYQGTTSPKRNVVGYSCSDSGTFSSATAGAVVNIGGVYAY